MGKQSFISPPPKYVVELQGLIRFMWTFLKEKHLPVYGKILPRPCPPEQTLTCG